MALELEKEMPSGLVGDYWRLGEIHINLGKDNSDRPAQGMVRLFMFKDENFAKELHRPPGGNAQITIELANLPMTEITALVAALYAKVKTEPQFAAAVDV